jgi:hypothetical protein
MYWKKHFEFFCSIGRCICAPPYQLVGQAGHVVAGVRVEEPGKVDGVEDEDRPVEDALAEPVAYGRQGPDPGAPAAEEALAPVVGDHQLEAPVRREHHLEAGLGQPEA